MENADRDLLTLPHLSCTSSAALTSSAAHTASKHRRLPPQNTRNTDHNHQTKEEMMALAYTIAY